MAARTRTINIAILIVASVFSCEPRCFGASVNWVVTQTNPNGVPAAGNQYVIAAQIAGLSGPAFVGSNLITFSGALANATSPGTPSGSLYLAPKILFQAEADLANTNDAANYARKNDSYFANPFRALFLTGGANESATTLTIDAAGYGALPSKVPGNGTYSFAFINVTGEAGVEIHGVFAVDDQLFPIGEAGLKLTLDGQLVPLPSLPGDYNADGAVDAADYVTWRKGGPLQNDVTPGVELEDYNVWQSQFGATTGSSALVGTVPATIPEPSSLGLLMIAIGCNSRCSCNGWHGTGNNS